jgi:ATP-binding cassette subfamily B protein
VLVVIDAATGVSRFFMRQALMGASREVEHDVRGHVFAQLQKLPIAYFASQRTGDVMSRATNDLNAIRTMVWPAAMEAVSTLLTAVFVVPPCCTSTSG